MIGFTLNLIYSSITVEFFIHLIFGVFINSFLLVVIGQFSTQFLVTNQIQLGIYLAIGLKLIELISNQHDVYFLDRCRRDFRYKVHQMIHFKLHSRYMESEWNDARQLGKDKFDQVANQAKWGILSFVSSTLSQIISIFPAIGYSLWLLYNSPMSFLFLSVTVIICLKFIQKPEDNNEEFNDAWDNYWIENNSKFTKSIHGQGKNCLEKTTELIGKVEKFNNAMGDSSTKYFNKINSIIVLAIMLDMYVKSYYSNDITFFILYVQYISIIKNNIKMIGNFFITYKETKVKFDKFEKMFEGKKPRVIIPQILPKKSIKLTHLNFKYPDKKEKNDEKGEHKQKLQFHLHTSNTITFSFGETIRLEGDIANGKSTFMDIFSGVIPYSTCVGSEVWIDGFYAKNGFSSFVDHRLYCEQKPDMNWKPSIYEIVSGNNPDLGPEIVIGDKSEGKAIHIDQQIEDQVWSALEQSCCDDFFTRNENCAIDTGKKWIYAKDISPSPGLKACIGLARIFFQAFTGKYKIIIGDEIDASVSATRAKQAMTNLMNFCRDSDILLIVSAHTTEVQNLEYDKVLKFQKGFIYEI